MVKFAFYQQNKCKFAFYQTQLKVWTLIHQCEECKTKTKSFEETSLIIQTQYISYFLSLHCWFLLQVLYYVTNKIMNDYQATLVMVTV